MRSTDPTSRVRRQRLLDLLNQTTSQALTVVCGPAGTGKTALLAAWAAEQHHAHPVEWIDLQDAAGAETRLAVAAAAGCPGRRLTVVLDGYEHAPCSVADHLDWLLQHRAGSLRLVVATRDDSRLPMYRYRLAGDVAEIRLTDLAFTDHEAGDLLACEGIVLSKEALQTLNRRTGGWAAGLRYASMLLRQGDSSDAALMRVNGGSGDIADYLEAEVLEAQPPRARSLLLSTSIPEVLEPGLVEELAGAAAGNDLEQLRRRGTVFLEAIAESPGAYRYVPVFREFLLAQAMLESPRALRARQRRTTRWYADRGRMPEAVRSAVAGGFPLRTTGPAARRGLEALAAECRPARHVAGALAHLDGAAAPNPVEASLVAARSRVARGKEIRAEVRQVPALASEVSSSPAPELVERLTARELEVLNRLADHLSTEEIAAGLYITVHTVRTHVRNILRKLNVPRRAQAIRRARDLGLLSPQPTSRAENTQQSM